MGCHGRDTSPVASCLKFGQKDWTGLDFKTLPTCLVGLPAVRRLVGYAWDSRSYLYFISAQMKMAVNDVKYVRTRRNQSRTQGSLTTP